MKLLWLCNMTPGIVKEKLTGIPSGGGLWVDHVLADLRKLDMTIRILCPGDGTAGEVDEKCGFATFQTGRPYQYLPELEGTFRKELVRYRPDVVHIWGTEYAHTLAMVRACDAEDLLDHTAVSIQGLCSVYAGHYTEGLPRRVCKEWTIRDLLRWDNIEMQRKKFAMRGKLEEKALKQVRHIIGRTDWDRACTQVLNPEAAYHFCNETLRQCFYEGRWRYDSCQKHRIFASSCVYPVKGFHSLLEAFAQVVSYYPDATLAVPGKSFLDGDPLRRSSYQKYLKELTKRWGLEGKIEFLGSLSDREMKREYLRANVFVLPSTIENSPNSLGEAMLLGVPCVASHVGGVAELLDHGREGYVYQPAAPYMLAHYIRRVFDLEERAEVLGAAAAVHGADTHNAQKNLERLLDIYEEIGK